MAGRTESVPSAIVGRGKLNDGAMASMIWAVSPLLPAASICFSSMTSTGPAFSAAARRFS